MAHIECGECRWRQRPFWTAQDNPVVRATDHLGLLVEALERRPGDRRVRYDLRGVLDPQVEVSPTGRTELSTPEFLAACLELQASRIRSQRWWTEESFRRDVDPVCPNCGGSGLLIVQEGG